MSSSSEASLSCSCGTVHGSLAANPRDYRLICTCRGCQSYAKFLGRETDLLDETGGSEVWQLRPSQIRLSGSDAALRCVRMTQGGALRWYAACCNTPVCNTLEYGWIPWVSMPAQFISWDGDKPMPPLRYRIYGRHATAPVKGAHPGAPPGMVMRNAGNIVRDVVAGRAHPSPFFDRATGKPVLQPQLHGG